MRLIDELRAKSEQAENKRDEVVAEIKASFDNVFNGERFEERLRRRIDASDIKARKTFIKIEFWEHHEGCSTTHFHCCGFEWYNPENKNGRESRKYKGVELRTIDKEVCNYLSSRLERKMSELGFHLVSKEDQKNSFGYYDTHFYFGW